MILSTAMQGVPFAVAGCADLLALFRCVSCRFKFGTDTAKPALMGAVGRVFMSGKPEMSHNIQQYDKTQFLRVEEAHRCRVHSALFMPLYAASNRRHPFGVFEVVPADTHVPFPVLMQWLKFYLQEVQLYTADATQVALTVGSRVHTMSPASESHKPPSSSHKATKERPSATMTHCSASSFHDHGHAKGAKQGSPASAVEGGMPVSQVHEVSADSEEEKTCSSRGRVNWSPESSALVAGSCGASFIKQEAPGKLQSPSEGNFTSPATTSASTCLPAQLVAIGGTLQLQTSTAPTDLQPPFPAPPTSVPDVAASVSTAAGAQSPVVQLQHQQQQQQLQFLANALQLQSQLKAHVQAQQGGSAFAGYQAFSTPRPAPLGSLVQQHSAPVPCNEEDAGDDEEVQVNNRVAGGAGKRLSVEDLQSQFAVGLREAAHNLRICPTTLKRACRRHGIYRWPRRQSWGGGPGDDGGADSMSLDMDLLPPSGATTGSEPQGSAPALSGPGQQSLPGLLPGCSSGLPVFQSPFAGQGQGPLHGQLAAPSFGQVPGQGQLPGKSPALEGFQRLDSAGQLALLQRLTAGKPGNPDNKWAQGNGLNKQLPASLIRAPAVTTPAVGGLTMPARQLGTGMASSMLATGLDRTHTPPLPLTASKPPVTMPRQALGPTATTLPYFSMLGSHSATSRHTPPAFSSQNHSRPFMDRQTPTPGHLQGFGQQAPLQQGIFQQDAYRQQPGSLLAALSSTSTFTSVPPPQVSVAQPHGLSLPWQPQTHAQTAGVVPPVSQLRHMPASPGLRGGEPQSGPQLQAVIPQADNRFLQNVQAHHTVLPSSSVRSEGEIDRLNCGAIDTIGLKTPADMECVSGQGSAAMEFDASDHGLGSLDYFLGEAGLDLEHPGALDFDPADCMF
ncbi:hypothetical protein ABBQ32_009330 [Trebouxia sp. C0010 RCD-2024]